MLLLSGAVDQPGSMNLATLSFGQEILVAAISGLIAAAGAGTAVYTQLAVTSQRRHARNYVLDEILTKEALQRCYAATEILQRKQAGFLNVLGEDERLSELTRMNGGEPPANFQAVYDGWTQAYANLNGPTVILDEQDSRSLYSEALNGTNLAVAASDYLRRASGYDAWSIRRRFDRSPIDRYGDSLASSFLAFQARKFVERRLRTSNLVTRTAAWAGDRRRCGTEQAFKSRELATPEILTESLLRDIDIGADIVHPEEDAPFWQ